VLIGYSTNRGIDGVAHQLGFSGLSTGDQDAEARAMAKWVNDGGGLLGHPIQLVNYDYDENDDPVEAQQAACATWTEDHHVFAVLDTMQYADATLLECLDKARVPIISNAVPLSSLYRRYPLRISPAAATYERYMPALVDRLWAQGFFKGWDTKTGNANNVIPVKVGVTHFDNEDGRAYADALRKALARHGLRIDGEDSHGTAIQDNASSTSAAVIRFNGQGITHVFQANILFYQGADRQGYHPRYAFDDTLNATGIAGNTAASQLHGAMGSGYLPYWDASLAEAPTAASKQCLDIMRKVGLPAADQSTASTMMGFCDAFTMLAASVRAGGALTAAGMMSGVRALGTTYGSATTYRTRFATGRLDGAAAIRDFYYDDACSCFAFRNSQLHPV
jgi:ABC-type branched-subunit amino acid transport system substrate-binding protein